MNFNKIAANVIIQLMILLPIQISLSLAAPNIQSIEVMPISNSQIIVNFTTDEYADTRVNIGIDENLGILERSLALVTEHSITIAGLQPDTLYYLEVSAQNQSGFLEESTTTEQITTYKTNDILWVNLTKLKEEPIDTVVIEWETTADSNSILYYGNASDNLDRFIKDDNQVKQHSITFSGLEKDKTYYYKVKSSYVESSADSFTAPVDITPPTLTYTKPAQFTTNKTMVITGTISEDATIEIRSNLYPLRIRESGTTSYKATEGDFTATVDLYEGLNDIEITATDDYENYFRENFNVTVDSEEPQIELVDFSPYAPFKEYNLTVKTDEASKITIKLNNVSVESTTTYVTGLNKTLTITKENNTLEVIAEDEAGNIGKVIKQISQLEDLFIELLRPNITDPDIATKTANRYKLEWGAKSIKIEGRTNPGAQILVWKSMSSPIDTKNQSDHNITADANGYFSLEIKLASALTKADYERDEDYWKTQGGNTYEQALLIFDSFPEVTVYLHIEVMDKYGRKGKDGPIVLEISTEKCGSGYAWSVDPDLDDHSFKPHRLKDGTELLSFKFKLDWIGLGESPEIERVDIQPQKKTLEMKENPQYDCFLKGEIFPRTPKIRMPDPQNGTFWFIRYKLNPWKGLNDSLQDSWHEAFKNLANKKCIIPLKLVIDYKYTAINGTTGVRGTQVWCFEQENLIEDQLDPRLVFPPELLGAGIAIVNTTLKFLDIIDPILYGVYVGTRISCVVAAGIYYGYYVSTKFRCLRSFVKDNMNQQEKEQAVQGCANKIKTLKGLYNKYRVACDRIWCKTVPYKPPAAEDYIEGNTLQIKKGPKNGKCLDDPDYACVKDVTLYEYYCGTKWPNHYQTTDCPHQKISDRERQICCRREGKAKGKGIIKAVSIIYDESVKYGEAGYTDFHKGEKVGQWWVDDTKEDWNYGIWYGFGAETVKGLLGPPVFTGPGGNIAAGVIKNKYRAQKTGKTTHTSKHIEALGKTKNIKDFLPSEVYYDTYISGLHGPSCRDIERPTGRNELYLAPSQDFIDSLKCRCISDIYGRERQLKRILEYLQQCLHQVKETGEANAGACKQLFTQYACDLLTWALVKGGLWLANSLDYGLGTQEVKPDEIRAGDALSLSIGGAVDLFKDDYGAETYPGLDFSMTYVTRTMCLAAFNNEWFEGLKSMFLGDVEGPPRQSSAVIAPASREILGSNPITGTATYEYQMGVFFSAGSNIKYYKVELVCDDEGDCPSTPKSKLFRTTNGEIDTGRITDIKKNEFSSVGGTMIIEDEEFRYNKIRVTWESSDDKTRFSSSEEVDITGDASDYRLFDCEITPGAALGGNDLVSCGLFRTGTYAEFIRPPPKDLTIAVTQATQKVEIPFRIKGVYESPEDEVTPLLLLMQETNSDFKTPLGQSKPPQPIRTGTQTHEDFDTFYFNLANLGSGLATIERDTKTSPSSTCQYYTEPGAVSRQGEITVTFPDVTDFTATEKRTSVDDGGAYGLSTKVGCQGVTICCSGTNCKYEGGNLVLQVEGAKIIITPKKGDTCKFTVTPSQGTGTATNTRVKYYLISIRENAGDNTAGSVKYMAGKPQEYPVTVTFIRTLPSQAPQQPTPAADIEGAETLAITISAAQEGAPSTQTGIKTETAKSVTINVIPQGLDVTIGKTVYSLENPTGKTLIPADPTASKPEITNNKITIQGTYFAEPGTYTLKVIAQGKKQGETVKRTEMFDITVTGPSKKPQQPSDFRGQYQNGKITLTWNYPPIRENIKHYKIELTRKTPEELPELHIIKSETGNALDLDIELIDKIQTFAITIQSVSKENIESEPYPTTVTVQAGISLVVEDFTATYNSHRNRVELKWKKIEGVSGYKVSGTGITGTKEFGKTQDNFYVNNPPSGPSTYKIIAVKGGLEGPPKEITYEVPMGGEPPGQNQ